MPEERPDLRDSPRITVNQEFDGIEAFVTEYVTNISRSGVFIRSGTPLPVGTRVNLKFTVLLDEIETVEGIGEVVRSQSGPGTQSGMGVVFVELTPDSERLIERVMRIYAESLEEAAS